MAEHAGMAVDVATYCCVLVALGREAEAEAEGVGGDRAGDDGVGKGQASTTAGGRWSEASRILEAMQAAGLEPDAASYRAAILVSEAEMRRLVEHEYDHPGDTKQWTKVVRIWSEWGAASAGSLRGGEEGPLDLPCYIAVLRYLHQC